MNKPYRQKQKLIKTNEKSSIGLLSEVKPRLFCCKRVRFSSMGLSFITKHMVIKGF